VIFCLRISKSDQSMNISAFISGGEYSITTEDGRVRPKHVLIEFKK
jgi:hypothetical protein